jgi:hypothetical protein
MKKMSFASRWIHLLMSCVWTVSYSILIDGQSHGHIVPTKGVRQGDPLSSYFFIICAETMSSLLHQTPREGVIYGIPISCGGTTINHLFFADDSLLFCRENLCEWGKIQEVLECYEAASGKKINREKNLAFL